MVVTKIVVMPVSAVLVTMAVLLMPAVVEV